MPFQFVAGLPLVEFSRQPISPFQRTEMDKWAFPDTSDIPACIRFIRP